MNCLDNQKHISQQDFECLGDIAQHCDLSKLCIAIEEAKTFDLTPLFCFGIVNDILNNWDLIASDKEYDKYSKLICGGSYLDCNGKLNNMLGFKKVWVYYAYSRYLLINGYNDTPNGLRSKETDFSIPVRLNELTDFSNKYRSMGYIAYEGVFKYLCFNKMDFKNFDDCNCPSECGCSGACSCGKTQKITGIQFKTISRR